MKKRLAAFTIPELLIYMIIAGVVLLAVMEGFLLLNNYTKKRTEKILSTAEMYDDYRRLVAFVNEADSIGTYDVYVELFDNGEICCQMSVSPDSMLLVGHNFARDTLFRRVVELASLNDTLSLEVLNDNDSLLQFRLAVLPDEHKKIGETLEDKEIKYQYE